MCLVECEMPESTVTATCENVLFCECLVDGDFFRIVVLCLGKGWGSQLRTRDSGLRLISTGGVVMNPPKSSGSDQAALLLAAV